MNMERNMEDIWVRHIAARHYATFPKEGSWAILIANGDRRAVGAADGSENLHRREVCSKSMFQTCVSCVSLKL